MKLPKLAITKRTALVAMGSLFVGALIILGVRFFRYNPEQVHYHANFAVYINGGRESFKSPFYYEEVSGSCGLGKNVTPAQRTHLHDNVNDVIHIHDHGVTYGDLFMNIGWAVGSDFIKTPEGILQPDADHHITYLINGKEIADISTEVIHDEDRLLVDYGNTSAKTLQKESGSVTRSAHHYDITKDPAACLGNVKPTWKDRLKHLF
jgi:hypothetical protein